MTTPKVVHEGLDSHEEFNELIDAVDNPRAALNIRTAVQLLGDATEMEEEYRFDEFDIQEVGWLRLAWEAHHEKHQTKI
jgi:hypothetical protein